MELQTIREVSRQFGISTRTLRYYEQIGLITPIKKEGLSYRCYDAHTITQIQQILILRKLRIPLKKIVDILKSNSMQTALNALACNLCEIEDEITALSTVRDSIKIFMERLKEKPKRIDSQFALPEEESLLAIVNSLTISSNNLKEGKTMNDLYHAGETLNRLTDKEVRIVYLPPSAVAAYQYVGDDPELHCHQVVDRFVLETGLLQSKPDLRHYGFNAPNPVDETGAHGYAVWVTIPDAMQVPAPLVKQQFEGGLYAAHTIPFGAFEEWSLLSEWVQNSPLYQSNSGGKASECMWGCLEEHLNYIHHVTLAVTEPEGLQLDLLYPVKEIAE